MSKSVIHVGLDVHAQTIAIALAGGGAEPRHYGSICWPSANEFTPTVCAALRLQ